MIQGRLLIKHAVGGRTFLDTGKTDAPFKMEQTGSGWVLTAQVDPGDTVNTIVKWGHELNLFVFEEHLQPVVKHWFYVLEGGVSYDFSTRMLRIEAVSELAYVPDNYTW
jgi:hypothetical protein